MKRLIIILAVTFMANSCTAREWTVPKPPAGGGTVIPDPPQPPTLPDTPKYGSRCHFVASAAEITALGTVAAGDTIVLKNGEWHDQQITMIQNGTATTPTVVIAEDAGKVIFTGNSRLRFSGEWIIVEGLWFRDVVVPSGEIIAFRTSSTQFANHSALRNCAITGFGLSQSPTDYKWVSLYGQDNEVSGCSLLDKRNMGTTLVVWLNNGVEARHIIKGNLLTRPAAILDENGDRANGQETLRIGTSEVAKTEAKCIVEANYFYRCNGETEIVSNKSCRNIYRSNVFEESVGTLTLRHGNDCEVYGNAVYGNGIAGTGGIRLIGFRHRVYNNFIKETCGSGFSSAICLVQGEENSPENGYFEATDCYVEHNTMVNCVNAITVNYGNSRHKVPIKNNTIADNTISNNSASYYVFTVQTTPLPAVNTTYRNNVYYSGKFKNCTASQVGAVIGSGTFNPVLPTGLPTRGSAGVKFTVE